MVNSLKERLFPTYDENSIIKLLLSTGSKNMKNEKLVRCLISSGCIASMTHINGERVCKITDPNYIPKDGEVFSMYDGMFGASCEWYVYLDGKMTIYP